MDKKLVQWPEKPDKAAFYGLAGEVVHAIEPHTESDPIALLVMFLAFFGNVIGSSAHFMVEATRHTLKLFLAIIGVTARGRKGTASDHIRQLFQKIDSLWATSRIVSGLISGEGLISNVRDPVLHGDEVVDEGESDKRLLVIESEFARVLRVMRREGNSLSMNIRDAWDNVALRTLARNSPLKSTDSHISMIAHCTKDEALRHITETDAANGFANRYQWFCVRRSKMLPRGGRIQEANLAPLTQKLRQAIEFGKSAGQLDFDHEAGALWDKVYKELSKDWPGLFGTIIARSEPQVIRLACLYALLDLSAVIRKEHLSAALELWGYSEESARYIFGDTLGDPDADEICRALRNTSDGLSRSQISDLFGRNKSALQISRALSALVENGLAKPETVAVGTNGQKGRQAEVWYAV